jgi:hypothetical protein
MGRDEVIWSVGQRTTVSGPAQLADLAASFLGSRDDNFPWPRSPSSSSGDLFFSGDFELHERESGTASST